MSRSVFTNSSLVVFMKDGIITKAKVNRKMKKEIKGKQKRVSGTAKAKVATGKKK